MKHNNDSQQSDIIFNPGVNQTNEVLRLTPQGMYYMGEFIEDAGEAHRCFMLAMDPVRHERLTECPSIDEFSIELMQREYQTTVTVLFFFAMLCITFAVIMGTYYVL